MSWPVSSRWRSEIQSSTSRMLVFVDVLEKSGARAARLYPETGSIDVDSTREVRRQLTLTLGGDRNEFTKSEIKDLLDPRSRRELRVWRGLIYTDNTVEMVPLGTFGIKKPSIDKQAGVGGVKISLTGVDRSRRLARTRWSNRFPITDSPTVPVAIARIVTNRLPWIRLDCAPSTVVVPPIWLGLDPANSSPWQDIATIAQAAGQEAIVDPMGTLIIRPISDPAITAPITAFIPGPTNTINKITRTLDDEQTFNGVILTGEGTGVPIPLRSEAWDMDPGSLTYRTTYGDVPYFATTNIAPSQAVLDVACAAMLRKMIGLTEQASADITPDPSLDGGDILNIEDPETGLTGLYILNTLNVPLVTSNSMSIQLRERRIG